MNLRKITGWIIVISIILWVGWDIYVWAEPTPGDTISEIVRDYSWRFLSLPLAVGSLCGHFFLNREGKGYFWVLVAIWILTLIVDIVTTFSVMPVIPFLAGIPLGGYLWPQAKV